MWRKYVTNVTNLKIFKNKFELEKIYVQVCVQLPQDSDREVGNLMAIKRGKSLRLWSLE